jgi:hypothetical protein
MFATTLRCVSITPFGNPVVPDEYGNTTTSSAGSISTAGGAPSHSISRSERAAAVSSSVSSSIVRPAASIAARAFAARSAVVTSSFAPESVSWNARSWLVPAGFAGRTMAPRLATA